MDRCGVGWIGAVWCGVDEEKVKKKERCRTSSRGDDAEHTYEIIQDNEMHYRMVKSESTIL